MVNGHRKPYRYCSREIIGRPKLNMPLISYIITDDVRRARMQKVDQGEGEQKTVHKTSACVTWTLLIGHVTINSMSQNKIFFLRSTQQLKRQERHEKIVLIIETIIVIDYCVAIDTIFFASFSLSPSLSHSLPFNHFLPLSLPPTFLPLPHRIKWSIMCPICVPFPIKRLDWEWKEERKKNATNLMPYRNETLISAVM